MNNMPIPQKITLCDGVDLRVITTDSFKTSRLGVYFILPADKNNAPVYTLLRGVLMRGCEKYPSLERLNIALDELYGTTMTMRNFLDGDRQVISFNCEMLDARYAEFDGDENIDILEGTVDVLRQLLLFPVLENGTFRRDVTEMEKEYQCDLIRDDISDTASYAKEAFRRAICRGEGYGVSLLGNVDYVQSITAERIFEGWQSLICSAAVEMFYVGSESSERVGSILRSAFADTPVFLPRQSNRIASAIHVGKEKTNFVSEDKPVSQAKLIMGWRYEGDTSLDKYCAAMVLCELLGVMQSSLLYVNIRERLGLCYHCAAALEPSKWILSVFCGIDPRNRRLAACEILRIFKEIQDGTLSEDVLRLAKLSLENYLRQLPDSAGAMEGFYLARALEGGERENLTPDGFLTMINRVTREDVISSARAFLLDTVYFLNATESDGDSSAQ